MSVLASLRHRRDQQRVRRQIEDAREIVDQLVENLPPSILTDHLIEARYELDHALEMTG